MKYFINKPLLGLFLLTRKPLNHFLLPKKENSNANLVYKINCLHCDKCYVGVTKQYLKERLRQCKNYCADKNKQKKEKTALIEYLFDKNVNFNSEEF